MQHTTILLIKFISCIIAFAIGLDLFFDATIVDILSFSLFVTIVSYMLGDRIVLPHLGNTAAIVIDFLLVYMSVWIFGDILLENYMQIAWGSVLSAIVITAAEVLVHHYLLNRISAAQTKDRQQTNFNRNLAFGTEFAEEEDIWDKNSSKK
jgi:hypothetical protein